MKKNLSVSSPNSNITPSQSQSCVTVTLMPKVAIQVMHGHKCE
jgi:hypothetical protein